MDTDTANTNRNAIIIVKISEHKHIFYLLHRIPRNNKWKAFLELVLAMVPVLDPAGFIGLRGNGLTPSKIDDFLRKLL